MKSWKHYIPLIVIIGVNILASVPENIYRNSDFTLINLMCQLSLVVFVMYKWAGSFQIIKRNALAHSVFTIYIYNLCFDAIDFILFYGFDVVLPEWTYYVRYTLLLVLFISLRFKKYYDPNAIKSQKFNRSKIYLFARAPKKWYEYAGSLLRVSPVGSYGIIYKEEKYAYVDGFLTSKRMNEKAWKEMIRKGKYVIREISTHENFLNQLRNEESKRRKYNIFTNNSAHFVKRLGYDPKQIMK